MALTKQTEGKTGKSYMCEAEVELLRCILHEGGRKKPPHIWTQKKERRKKMNETREQRDEGEEEGERKYR